ncbi:MAG TPA: polysaccharide biosynthesis/export family protein [Flavobacteriales bacterium]|nr:polysaccharide biosynthesis/export family protein [Flavobacteriales bacterium]
MPIPSRTLWGALLVAVVAAGCTINRDIMFKTSLDHQFDAFTDTTDIARRIRLQPNDILQFRLFANDGFKMIDLVSEGGVREAAFLNRVMFSYVIESDGECKLPLLGRVILAGKTLREAESFLEERYSTYYQRPYVQLLVINRRVVVFPGGGGDARVIPIENNNTTLLEALAMAGGMSNRGDARKVKLFRNLPDGRRAVHQFDLSDIEGLKYADIVLQGDDIIYVQPNPELVREALQDLTPVITLLTSIVLVIGVVRSFAR